MSDAAHVYWLGFCLCVGMTLLTFVVVEVARHLQYLKYRETGFVPGTQHWCLIASAIAGVFELAAVVYLVLYCLNRPASLQ